MSCTSPYGLQLHATYTAKGILLGKFGTIPQEKKEPDVNVRGSLGFGVLGLLPKGQRTQIIGL